MADTKALASSLANRWRAISSSEWKALRNWLLVWTLLANAAFALMYIVGSPPRHSEIILFGIVGLIVRDKSYPIQCAAFVAAMAYSMLSFIAGLFNLSIFSLAHSVVFLAELDVGQSAEYVFGGGLFSILIIAGCTLLRRPTDFKDIRVTLLAVLATLLMAVIDLGFGLDMRGHYNRVAGPDTPFQSAISQSEIVPDAGPLDRNLVVIMVESLGVPVNNEEMTKLLFANYKTDAVQSRFAVSSGSTAYYSSTTSGEIRELCGRWDEYHELRDSVDSTCLPARLAAQGVPTTAYHSFDSHFFDRNIWYPNIGFQHRYFRDDLINNGAQECGGVFPGACDRDVPQQIAKRLEKGGKPQFIYWLTVNSHLPVPLDGNLEVDNCERVSAKLAEEFPMICRQFAIWDGIDKELVRQIMSPQFPATDILIVGDHMPPYFDRHNRSQFAPDRVPWLLLKWRGE